MAAPGVLAAAGPSGRMHHACVTEWPFEADNWVPSPELVAVWAKLGMIPPERVPLWAAHWLVAGYDGEHVVHLAGLHGDDSREVNDSLRDALLDCGVTLPESEAAAVAVVYADLARMHLDGKAGALWACQQVNRLLSRFQFNDLMRLPVSRLYDIDCEWDGGWGRTVQQLAASAAAAQPGGWTPRARRNRIAMSCPSVKCRSGDGHRAPRSRRG
jgi:hypothetical protein